MVRPRFIILQGYLSTKTSCSTCYSASCSNEAALIDSRLVTLRWKSEKTSLMWPGGGINEIIIQHLKFFNVYMLNVNYTPQCFIQRLKSNIYRNLHEKAWTSSFL